MRAQKHRMVLVAIAGILLVIATSTFGAEKEPFRWTKVGGDPCNPVAGCTLEWAVGKTGWPEEVQKGLVAAVKRGEAKSFILTKGWRGWMTWGKHFPKFKSDVIAAWPEGQIEESLLWTLDRDRKRYHLVRVAKCQNWGGWVSPVPIVAPQQPPLQPVVAAVVEEDRMPLGVLPIVSCPE